MPVIAVYARASRDRSEKRVSVERQTARCLQLAGERFPGDEVVTFEDNDLSGADPDVERPAYNKMLGAIRRGEVAEVVVHEQSRLTRQPAQWDELVVTLTRAGITKVHTVQSGVVPVEAGNRLLGRILAVVDAEEAERTKARMLAAHAQLAAEGRPGGTAPYGYRNAIGDDGRPTYVIEPAEAKVVRHIAARLVAGYSINSIANELDQSGVPTPKGAKRWRFSTALAVRKPAVAGHREYRGEVVGPARWEAILSTETWEEVLWALRATTVTDAKGRRYKAQRLNHTGVKRWLLSAGLARCGGCGGQMTVGAEGCRADPKRVYRCAKVAGGCGKVSVSSAELFEQLVVSEVLDALDKPAMAARLAAHVDPERVALSAELAGAEALMNEAAELRGAGIYDKRRWERQFLPAKARADAARAELDALSGVDVDLPPADQVRRRWDDKSENPLSLRQKRAVLERCVEAVTVSPATVPGRSALPPEVRVVSRYKITWRA